MKKKILSLFMVIAITMFTFLPTIVRAETPLIQHRITVSPDIMTVYVGNVSVDGTSEIKYLYIENAVNSATVNNGLSKILTSDYSDMLARGTISSDGTVKVSNSHEADMSASWKNATNVANTYYGTTGTISDTSTTQINYNQTKYNEAVSDASDLATAEINAISSYNTAYQERKIEYETSNPGYDYSGIEEYTPPVRTNYDLSSLTGEYIIIDNITRAGEDNFAYWMLNGQLKRYNLVDIDRTIVRVVNTSANVTTSSTTQYGHNNIWTTSGGQVAVLYENRDTSEQANLDGNHYVDLGHVVDYVVGDSITVKAKANDGYKFVGWYVSDVQKGAEYYYRDQLVSTNANYTYQPGVTTISGIDGTINYLTAAFEEDTTPTQTTPTYEYIDDTANQTYTIGEDGATFRINADYSLFENGGKVYVDDALVSSDNYTSKSGSTIITFTKDYMSSLSEGEHTLKVTFNNGGEATTKFTVAKTEESTNNPQTGDNVMFYISMLGLSIIGLAGAGLYIRKRRFN